MTRGAVAAAAVVAAAVAASAVAVVVAASADPGEWEAASGEALHPASAVAALIQGERAAAQPWAAITAAAGPSVVADHTAGQAASVPIAPLHFLLLAPEGRASLGRRPEALDVREQLAVPDVPGASEAQAESASPEESGESGASAGLAVPASQVALAGSAASVVLAELVELAASAESAESAAPAVLAPASYQQGAKATGTTSAMAIE